MNRKYTKQELIEKKQFLIFELQRFYKEKGRVPTQRDMNKNDEYPSYSIYIYYFGSWNNALELARLEINEIHPKLDGTEICTNCNKKANEILGFTQWYYIKNENYKRYCNKCGNSRGIYYYKKGQLNINSEKGRGRAGEITIIKALKIGNEFDCNRLSCDYPFDIHNEKYGKIDVKTSVLSNYYNTWKFNFVAKKVADIYICLGMSLDTKRVEYVWIVPNKGKFRELTSFQVYDTYGSLRNRSKWEVDVRPYNEAWQEMLENYTDGKCKVFGKKIEEEWTEERQEKYEQFKKDFLKKHNLREVV